MARPASTRRGQPILALLAIIMAWTSVRIALWNSEVVAANDAMARVGHGPVDRTRRERPAASLWVDARPSRQAAVSQGQPAGVGTTGGARPVANPMHTLPTLRYNLAFAPARHSRNGVAVQARSAAPWAAPVRHGSRWSFDQWLLMRAGSGFAAQAPGAASYGASQAGAVARFRLDSENRHGSYAYLRTSFAINAPGRDKDVALGFGIRPVAKLPLRVLAEARLYDSKLGPMRLRPVVTVISELPWQTLPAGLRLEAYGQAGYAAGTDGTAFFDAQAVLDRSVGNALGGAREVRVGAGLWAGGQEGAARLDLGPRVSVPLDLGGEVHGRIALDWRFRVAGNARPPSGPALTLASSF